MTKNEAARLPRALARVPANARVLVVDSESTDATVAIARAHDAAVDIRTWDGYVRARRYALGRVATPYAFMLDADEALDDVLIRALEEPLDACDGYRVRRTTMLVGKRVRAAGWSSERLVRCFRVDRARLESHSVGGGADLHERWIVAGRLGELPGTIVHDSYPTLASYHEKFARYTRLEAEPLPPSLRHLAQSLALWPLRFSWSMIRYGGWRDGWRGVFVSWYFGAYPVAVFWRALRARR